MKRKWKRKLTLSPLRAAEIFKEMVECRRIYGADTDFFRMADVWEWLCEDGDCSIKTYRSVEVEDYQRKAGVISFDGKSILTVDERLMENARKGCLLSNYMLAHELGHLALNHHARGAVIKNFQLFSGPDGMMCNAPPTVEELEANIAAVFFQCGIALMDPRWEAINLARRAFSDIHYVKIAQKIVKGEEFLRELKRQMPKRQRVIL
jgi:hypothetical protein